ncbi:hypothetical protein G6O67_008438 [Ophiocordyceps sinensis]|uniref:LYR motif-containing protein 2 n=1 Tax=Ophiocordyceps sinensis TaxID=72228 RepID=A0A8H4PMZ7_9HYPO|nr:hypothetical protein G6O67_008438 [Ophiocordyceps sinensis]
MSPGPQRLSRLVTHGTRRSLQADLSLHHFLQRAKVVAFYRAILRATGRIAHAPTRAETRKLARDEFERHRHVKDLSHIRFLMSTGKTEWERVERNIGGM